MVLISIALLTKSLFVKITKKVKKISKQLWGKDPEYTWVNQDVITNDGLPFIGEAKPGDIYRYGFIRLGE